MCFQAKSAPFVYFSAQSNPDPVETDPVLRPDTIPQIPDSAAIAADTTVLDLNGKNLWYTLSPDALDAIITYKGVDSIVYDLDSGKTYIYAKGEITYGTFYLKADCLQHHAHQS